VRYSTEREFLCRFSKTTHISNLIKTRPQGDQLFHANGRTDKQTDMTKLVVASRNYANAPNNGKIRVDFGSRQPRMFPGCNKRDSKSKLRTVRYV